MRSSQRPRLHPRSNRPFSCNDAALQVYTSAPAVSLRHASTRAGAAAGQRRGLVLPAEAAEPAAPEIYVDAVGAVSIVTDTDLAPMPGVFRNVDGHRNEDGRYAAFTEEITGFIPRERQFTDPVRTFAYGTDASFYRLNPRMVVKARTFWLRAASRQQSVSRQCELHPSNCRSTCFQGKPQMTLPKGM